MNVKNRVYQPLPLVLPCPPLCTPCNALTSSLLVVCLALPFALSAVSHAICLSLQCAVSTLKLR